MVYKLTKSLTAQWPGVPRAVLNSTPQPLLQLSTSGRHQAPQETRHRLGHVQHDEARARPGADPRQHERGRDGHVRLLPRREEGADSFDYTGATVSEYLEIQKRGQEPHSTSGDKSN